MQQLPKGIQYHSDTMTTAFRTRTGRLLLPDHPWVSSISLIVKCNSYQLKMLQLSKSQYIASTSKIDLWHQRLVHVNLKQLRQQIESSEGVDIQLSHSLMITHTIVEHAS